MKLKKTTRSVMSELAAKKPVKKPLKERVKLTKEGVIADLDLLAQEVRTYREFEKRFVQDFNKNMQVTAEEREMLQQLYNSAKNIQEAKKTGLLEVVSSPVDRAIIAMICEVASEFGVTKVPKKQWNSIANITRYVCKELDRKDRVEFTKVVRQINEGMDVQEFVINVANTKK